MYSLPMLALLLVVTGLLIHGAYGVVGKQLESEEHVAELSEKANALSSRKADLESRLQLLETEEGIIKEIKEKYSVSREGEYVVVLVDEAEEPVPVEDSEEFWGKKWLNSIKNLWRD